MVRWSISAVSPTSTRTTVATFDPSITAGESEGRRPADRQVVVEGAHVHRVVDRARNLNDERTDAIILLKGVGNGGAGRCGRGAVAGVGTALGDISVEPAALAVPLPMTPVAASAPATPSPARRRPIGRRARTR